MNLRNYHALLLDMDGLQPLISQKQMLMLPIQGC